MIPTVIYFFDHHQTEFPHSIESHAVPRFGEQVNVDGTDRYVQSVDWDLKFNRDGSPQRWDVGVVLSGSFDLSDE